MKRAFDYKGYNEDQLLNLCDEKRTLKGFSDWAYWTSEVYSYGVHMRHYGYYPSFLPLCVYSDHGADGDSNVYMHELETDASHFLFHYKNKIQNFKTKSQKKVDCIMSLFAWYRRKHNIIQEKNAKGTIAFPAHSIPDIDDVSNIENYIELLKQLPEEFQPVCVCLHMHDINKGQHKIFQKHGIPTYTVGHAFDQRFAQRFYSILKHFKYSTSNSIGSNVFYSVEIGIPFFLYGQEPEYVNISNPNFDKGKVTMDYQKEIISRFETYDNFTKTILTEQKKYVEDCLGINDGISRLELAKILYANYFKNGNLIKDLSCAVKLRLKFLKDKIRGRI